MRRRRREIEGGIGVCRWGKEEKESWMGGWMDGCRVKGQKSRTKSNEVTRCYRETSTMDGC